MEKRLTDFPPENYEGDEGNTAEVKIAVVTFAFNNAEIIHGLRERGLYIAACDWKKKEKLENKL